MSNTIVNIKSATVKNYICNNDSLTVYNYGNNTSDTRTLIDQNQRFYN